MIVLDEQPDGLSLVEDHGVVVGYVSLSTRRPWYLLGMYVAHCANEARTRVPGMFGDKQSAADALERYLESHPRLAERMR